MFALIESCPDQRRGDWPTRMAAVAVHVLLTAAAVAATRQAVAAVGGPAIIQVDTVWEPPHDAKPAVPAHTAPCTCTVVPDVPRIPVSPTADPSATVPSPDVPLAPFTGTDVVRDPGMPIAPVPGTGALPSVGAVLDERVVDERPAMLSHPALDYPEALRQAGIEGQVLIEAVLDTLGRAEPASLRVILGAHPLFDREAMAVVLGSRYRAARAGGHAVRVRIRVPVSFALRR